MPLEVKSGKLMLLGKCFLQEVFTERALARRISAANGTGRLTFADGQQADTPGRAAVAAFASAHFAIQCLQVSVDVRHHLLAAVGRPSYSWYVPAVLAKVSSLRRLLRPAFPGKHGARSEVRRCCGTAYIEHLP